MTQWRERERHQLIQPVTTLAFDGHQDLLWTGSAQGQISSFLYPGNSAFIRYTAFPLNLKSTPPLQILPLEYAVYAVGYENVKCTNKRGVTIWNKLVKNGTAICAASMHSELVVASNDGKFTLINLTRGSVLKEVEVDNGIIALKHGKYICSASSTGNVSFRDPATYKEEHSTNCHTGGVTSMDISGNYMITTGYSVRGASLMPDPMIKVYDIRVHKFLPPVPCSAGPTFARFHPNYAASILAGSRDGALQISDINDSSNMKSIFLQAALSGYLTAIEFSPSGDFIAMGDAFGSIQLWSQRQTPKINNFSKPIVYRDLPYQENLPEMTDDTPLSAVGMPYYSKPLLSMWPNNLYFQVGRPSPKIPPEILKNVKMVDFVGYAKNPKTFRRNQAYNEFSQDPIKPKFRSEQELELMKSGESKPQEDHGNQNVSIKNGIPHHYRSVEIKYSRFGVEDFDFGFYNKTEYAGLETDIQNSYCNSLLQMLFFIWPLRELAKAHIRVSCFREPCLTCELGFLFRMLEGSNGVNCQASNFLRAFGLVRQANALGLLEPEHITVDSKIAYGALIQTFFRFILEQIHQELAVTNAGLPGDRFLQRLFSISLLSVSTCNRDGRHRTERETFPFVIDLQYPRNASDRPSFVDILAKSINKESITKAWCSSCNQYQMTTHHKKIIGMPNFLCINANVAGDMDLQIWLDDSQAKNHWLPAKIALIIDGSGLKIIDLDRSAFNPSEFPNSDVAIFDLRATIAEVKLKKGPGHLVSHINVSEDTEKPLWYLFNDFSVSQVSNEERVFKKWKTPCIIQYARRSAETSSSFFLSPVNPDFRILLDNHLLNQRTDLQIRYVPLSPDEIPRQPGYLCAIDAEFVIMSTAEAEVRSDGTNTIIRPPRYSLARVSVVRGEGDEGIPFIDDYIATTEPVCDYLTEYSGINDGDLDPAQSIHPLVSLKVAYKRLRLLVDMGCIFVGHDLRKDCRTINIHIPPAQIIDTVNIFKFKNRQRKLSLRFLAWCLLREDIQTTTHDSIEDARTALALYKKYLEIKENGNFEKVMEEIYSEGKATQFRSPSQQIQRQNRDRVHSSDDRGFMPSSL